MILVASVAQARDIDITANDGGLHPQQYANDPRPGVQEVGYVSPASIADNSWDLKLVGYNPTTHTVSIVGGFNFLTGNGLYAMGDLFFKTGGGVLPHPSRPAPVDGAFNYPNPGFNYAVHFTSVAGSTLLYDVYALSPASVVKTVLFAANAEADPFALVPDSQSTLLESGVANVTGGLTSAVVDAAFNTDIGNTGDNFQLQANLGFLAGKDFSLFCTYECGNDALKGQYIAAAVPVPEVGTWAAAVGLLVVAGFSARRLVSK